MTQAPRQKKFIPLHSWTPWCNNLVHRVQKFTPISSSDQQISIKIVSTTNFEIFTLYNNEKDCCLSVVSTSIRLKLQVRVSLSHSIIWHFQGMHLLWWFGYFLYIFCIEPSLSLYTFRTLKQISHTWTFIRNKQFCNPLGKKLENPKILSSNLFFHHPVAFDCPSPKNQSYIYVRMNDSHIATSREIKTFTLSYCMLTIQYL